MKTHDYLYYIDEAKWDKFLQEYERFGFKREGGFAYPDYVYRNTNDGKSIEISIDKPCVNMWDGEDKNQQREIWLWSEKFNDRNRNGTCRKKDVSPYIQDLFDAGFVKRETEAENA